MYVNNGEPLIDSFKKSREVLYKGQVVRPGLVLDVDKESNIGIRYVRFKKKPRQFLLLLAKKCMLNVGGSIQPSFRDWPDRGARDFMFYPVQCKRGSQVIIWNGCQTRFGPLSGLGNSALILEELEPKRRFLLRFSDSESTPADFESLVVEVHLLQGMEHRPTEVFENHR
jgi:hypothetical protein